MSTSPESGDTTEASAGPDDHDDHDEHDGHDHGPDKALVEALKRDLGALTTADLDLLLATGDMAYRSEVIRALKVKLNPRFLRTGMGRLLRPQVQRLADRVPAETADLLLLPPISPIVEAHLGDRYDDPSADDVAAVAALLIERFGARITRAYLLDIAVSDAPAAPLAAEAALALPG